MERAQQLLAKYALPKRDLYDLPTSPLSFPDGCQFRMEVSGVESVAELEAVADESGRRDIPIHRVIAIGAGTHSLTFGELQALARIARDARIELIVIPGPRANFDVGSHLSRRERVVESMFPYAVSSALRSRPSNSGS